MGRPRTNDETVKERLVECATELLATGSQESVTVRAVATAAGASTAAVYSLFGGKDGLIGAVRDKAVTSLFRAVTAAPTSEDPLADIYALAAAYRRWGREHSHLYSVLFGGVQSFKPSGAVGTSDPVRPLIAAIDRAVTESVLDGPATSIAVSLWVTLHGLVTLELAGAFDAATAEDAFGSSIHATLRGWATPAVFRGLRHDEPSGRA
ncbi:TetR family transcriptional regulator [Streptomyces viridochromogenes]|uniref:TetR family transcriptional regulator n=1 Tax=Streptomyces viridochromogenes TaxID=1938 RepID=A0A0J8BN59_STRVR|nr:TetR-like C-terminal domain-containing protein [Streptomyces viridochromogenes]KMS67005.1 TetR family transcriptional regulator [Streptomyces viridochromogenes]KOG06757.1 TetR family transcriptional regulator [Streptomyces viridochromogenes]KOG06845.1 TetR family transcriptional regulator [Streptomyces viridochromogenes]